MTLPKESSNENAVSCSSSCSAVSFLVRMNLPVSEENGLGISECVCGLNKIKSKKKKKEVEVFSVRLNLCAGPFLTE